MKKKQKKKKNQNGWTSGQKWGQKLMSKNYIKVTFEAWPCELRNSLLIAMQCNICKYCIVVTVICVKYAWHKDGAVLNIDGQMDGQTDQQQYPQAEPWWRASIWRSHRKVVIKQCSYHNNIIDIQNRLPYSTVVYPAIIVLFSCLMEVNHGVRTGPDYPFR